MHTYESAAKATEEIFKQEEKSYASLGFTPTDYKKRVIQGCSGPLKHRAKFLEIYAVETGHRQQPQKVEHDIAFSESARAAQIISLLAEEEKTGTDRKRKK